MIHLIDQLFPNDESHEYDDCETRCPCVNCGEPTDERDDCDDPLCAGCKEMT